MILSSSSPSRQWSSLPVEIQLAITQLLDVKTLHSLSLVSHCNRTLCLPAIYNSVTISSFVRLQRFVDHVPVDHALHIRALDISTAGNISNTAAITQEACSDALVRVLSLAPRLRTLSLHLSTELSPLAISSFSKAEQLTDLAIEPCRDAIHTSLSERTVVGIAVALPNLKSLSITRIARALPRPIDTWHCSSRHPPSPSDTRSCNTDGVRRLAATLPSLLSIPTLRHLGIHNTPLGDPLFSSTDLDVRCQLETIEIGAYESASPLENARWATHILLRAGSHLRGVALGSGVLSTAERLSLPALERVRLSPLFSPCHLPSTLRVLATASGSLRHIHVECLTDDLEDVCDELSECVEHVNGGPYNLKLRVFPALEGDALLAERPVSSDCVPVASLDETAQDALSRLEDAFSSAGAPISIVGSNVLQQEDEEQDWDDQTVVDETAVGMETKGALVAENPWVQIGGW